MNINEKLVTQVQEGKACIDNTESEPKKIYLLQRLTKAILPSYEFTPSGYYGYYSVKKSNTGLYWTYSDSLPTGLTPIPLDDFFKGGGEKLTESQIHSIIEDDEAEDALWECEDAVENGLEEFAEWLDKEGWQTGFTAKNGTRMWVRVGNLTGGMFTTNEIVNKYLNR